MSLKNVINEQRCDNFYEEKDYCTNPQWPKIEGVKNDTEAHCKEGMQDKCCSLGYGKDCPFLQTKWFLYTCIGAGVVVLIIVIAVIVICVVKKKRGGGGKDQNDQKDQEASEDGEDI